MSLETESREVAIRETAENFFDGRGQTLYITRSVLIDALWLVGKYMCARRTITEPLMQRGEAFIYLNTVDKTIELVTDEFWNMDIVKDISPVNATEIALTTTYDDVYYFCISQASEHPVGTASVSITNVVLSSTPEITTSTTADQPIEETTMANKYIIHTLLRPPKTYVPVEELATTYVAQSDDPVVVLLRKIYIESPSAERYRKSMLHARCEFKSSGNLYEVDPVLRAILNDHIFDCFGDEKSGNKSVVDTAIYFLRVLFSDGSMFNSYPSETMKYGCAYNVFSSIFGLDTENNTKQPATKKNKK